MSLLQHWPDMLTVEETAEILRTTPADVEGFISTGEILCTEIAEKALIPRRFGEFH